MISIKTSIDIAAPIDLVWAITENVLAWPDWTPTISVVKSIGDGPIRVGSRYLVKQPLQREAVWEVTQIEAGQRFCWQQQTGRHRFKAMHILEAVGNRTRNTLQLEGVGPTFAFLGPVLRPVLMSALKTENRSLKRFAELHRQ